MSVDTSAHLGIQEAVSEPGADRPSRKVLALFGTRPEVIKLAPVIRRLEARSHLFQTVTVASGQHTDLLHSFVRLFGLRIDHDLNVMAADQTPISVCARVLSGLDPIILAEQPDVLLVQGDTTTALAGALAAFHRRVPVAHVEAGLRSGRADRPFPEEMNRRLITRLASYHFAATPANRDTLLREGVDEDAVFLTGNPVVDSLDAMLASATTTPPAVARLLDATAGLKRVVLTTHRRESFGEVMSENLRTLRRFVEDHPDVALVFPVHPNPAVVKPAGLILAGHPRIHLMEPLGYEEFVILLSHAWLIVSDSGGVQEEAPTLGKPLLVLRRETERPEAIECGAAVLVDGGPAHLATLLEDTHRHGTWLERRGKIENPFGRGDSGERIVQALAMKLGVPITNIAEPSAVSS